MSDISPQTYNIFSRLEDELRDFDSNKINIANGNSQSLLRYLPNNVGGYHFSQKDTLNLVDLYYNSKFESGQFDTEGQRKVFMNIGKFRADVAAMQTDIDVKNYLFIPDSDDDVWKVWFMSRKFKIWARENYYGMLLNELNTDYSKYGTCVVKKVGKRLERVPLRTLRNSQDAKSLWDAVKNGGFVIEEHSMSLVQMKEFKEWDLEDLDFQGPTPVYERYSRVPRAVIKGVNGGSISESDWKDMVMTMAILIPRKDNKESNDKKGNIAFIEEITDIPYQECHWDKQDGRWLGVGEIENQFENQVARNFTANLRRRSLLWASKKIFQSTDESVKQNLVKEVKDGQVVTIAPNGNITELNTQNKNLAEFQADENSWEKNSDQKSFTYEVATGEALPSGTPLGLGVILSGATKKHFALKQQNFGLFLEKSFFKLVIPIFKKSTREHTLAIASGEEGIENLRNLMIEIKTGEAYLDKLADLRMDEEIPDIETFRLEVEDRVMKSPYFFVDVPDKLYTDAQMHMELNIVGEASNTLTDIQDYQFLYNAYSQRQDPRAETVLDILASKKGINTRSIRPRQSLQQPQAVQPEAPSPQPSINNITPNGTA